ncbi:hypothetical protein A0257_16290 [Hymenobacter psoromatis]|nr:hypothetical protein A0257_16290 [Hymenobacter psoromatis]
MEPINSDLLEKYAERHRADFDLHEPRPELWAALEKQLHGETPSDKRPVMGIVKDIHVAAELPVVRMQAARRWQHYGLAAALAALVIAAGVGERWKVNHAPVAVATPAMDAGLYVAPATGLVTASHREGADVDARLDTAVHGMERYYIAQLNDRKTQLGQLAPSATAEWAHELVGLDSSYQQLKRELPQHPQPEVVLTAMNRNLQIRLDILDRQLELHGGDHTALAAGNSGEYVLADSRVVADNVVVRRHGR